MPFRHASPSPLPTSASSPSRPSRRALGLGAALAIAFGATACGGGSVGDDAADASAEVSSAQAVAGEEMIRVSDDRPAHDDPPDGAAPEPDALQATAADDAAAPADAPTFTALAAQEDAVATTDATSTTSTPYCERVPTIGISGRVQTPAYKYGAIPNDGKDDTAAIQKAVDSMSAGDILLFTPGKYVISSSIHVRRAGLTLVGDGATIHATNPDDQAILIEADSVTVAKLTLTAVTDKRRSAPRHARIAVARPLIGGGYETVTGAVIRDNRIVPHGPPGSAGANGSSATGILMLRAKRFLIANNTIVRTLADGIHMTAGSRYGRVLNNTVKETGDDMIAMVSYALAGTAALNTASMMKADWSERVDKRLVRHIHVAGNDLGGQYWGRGITVVGGKAVTIARNVLDNVPRGAAVLLAREANYQTFGVDNVLAEGNVLRNIQNLEPPYDFRNLFANSSRTGHGAIEVHASLFEDEAADSTLRTELSVRNVLARRNTIERAAVSGARLGVGTSKTLSATNSSGRTVYRTMVSGVVSAQGFSTNKFAALAGDPVSLRSSTLQSKGVHCRDNLLDGSRWQPSLCKTAAPAVVGAGLTCSSDGRLL